MTVKKLEYGAIAVDTSVFVAHGMRLERGLLAKLRQFGVSPIEFLLPDVLFSELEVHLEKEMNKARKSLEKGIKESTDHLFFEPSKLEEAKKLLVEETPLKQVMVERLEFFFEDAGATEIVCSELTDIGKVMERYFSGLPPFSESGKKKSEFPDALILLALEAWAEREEKKVLTVAQDADWKNFCEGSAYLDYEEDFGAALSVFNSTVVAHNLAVQLRLHLQSGRAQEFIRSVDTHLKNNLADLSPEPKVDSHFFWEAGDTQADYRGFNFLSHEFDVVEANDDWIVIRGQASISVYAEADFSLSLHDSPYKDHVNMGSVFKTVEDEFESDLLITIAGDLSGPMNELEVTEVEVLEVIDSINFGTLEITPDF